MLGLAHLVWLVVLFEGLGAGGAISPEVGAEIMGLFGEVFGEGAAGGGDLHSNCTRLTIHPAQSRSLGRCQQDCRSWAISTVDYLLVVSTSLGPAVAAICQTCQTWG